MISTRVKTRILEKGENIAYKLLCQYVICTVGLVMAFDDKTEKELN